MKKIYQAPNTIVAEIEMQQMLAGSGEGNTITVEVSNQPGSFDGAESRRSFSVWGDDEEE